MEPTSLLRQQWVIIESYIETESSLNGKGLVNKTPNINKGQTVITLKAGDMVWIRHRGMEGNNIFDDQWSTFGGFQIN
jgi:hypothetical protein